VPGEAESCIDNSGFLAHVWCFCLCGDREPSAATSERTKFATTATAAAATTIIVAATINRRDVRVHLRINNPNSTFQDVVEGHRLDRNDQHRNG